MRRLRNSVGVLLAAGLVQLSCNSPSGPGTGPDIAHFILWNATRPALYTIEEQIFCFCPGGGTAARVSVRENVVTGVANAVTLAPLPREQWGRYKTVDELFALIASVSEDPDATVEVRYDEFYGYPTRISVDPIREAVDDEFTYVCGKLTPVSPPVASAGPSGGD